MSEYNSDSETEPWDVVSAFTKRAYEVKPHQFTAEELHRLFTRVASLEHFVTLALTQSSGWGKSRLMMEFASQHYCVYISLHPRLSTGFPKRTTSGYILEFEAFSGVKTVVDAIARVQATFTVFLNAGCKFAEEGGSPMQWFRFQTEDKMTAANIESLQLFSSSPREISKCYSEAICRFRKICNVPHVIIMIDEAEKLLGDEVFPTYQKLQIVRKAFLEFGGIAGLFASTDPRIQDTPPVIHRDPSAKQLVLHFSVFPSVSCVGPLDHKTISEVQCSFTETFDVKILSLFGRPLWRALYDNRIGDSGLTNTMVRIARRKLFSNGTLEECCLAVVLQLLGLRTTLPTELAEKLVANNMATLLYVDANREATYVTYISEPLLALGALDFVRFRLHHLLKALTSLYYRGFVTKGSAREAAVRLGLLRKLSEFYFNQSKSVKKLASELFGEWTSDDVLDNAVVNFTHFTCADFDLNSDSLLAALKRRAALVPKKETRKGYDAVIPFYTGDPHTRMSSEHVGAIFLQVKKRKVKLSVDVILEKLQEATMSVKHRLFWFFKRKKPSKQSTVPVTTISSLFDRYHQNLIDVLLKADLDIKALIEGEPVRIGEIKNVIDNRRKQFADVALSAIAISLDRETLGRRKKRSRRDRDSDCRASDCQDSDCRASDCQDSDCRASDCQDSDCRASDCQDSDCQDSDCQDDCRDSECQDK